MSDLNSGISFEEYYKQSMDALHRNTSALDGLMLKISTGAIGFTASFTAYTQVKLGVWTQIGCGLLIFNMCSSAFAFYISNQEIIFNLKKVAEGIYNAKTKFTNIRYSLDTIALISFVSGLAFTSYGINDSYSKKFLPIKVNTMSDKKNENVPAPKPKTQQRDSFNPPPTFIKPSPKPTPTPPPTEKK